MDMFMTRELANSFGNSDDEEEMYRRIFGSSSKDKTTTTTTKKPKYDAEEIREIEAKANGRRKKAYKNYEDACKVKGKFTVRSCPKIEDCYAKNKIKFIPLLAEKTTPAPTTTTKKAIGRREFIERALAFDFLDNLENDSDDDDDDDSNTAWKRFFMPKGANKELQEETKERKTKAFKKHEEYCEKRAFRIGAVRNCPQLKSELC